MRIAAFVLVLGAPFTGLAAPADAKIDFQKQVEPILAQRCHSCHGEDAQQSGLRLDKRQAAMRGGDYGPVILPGRSADSKLIKRITTGDGGMKMPPTGALPEEEIAILKAWIDQGADFRTEVKEEKPPAPIDPKVTSFISTVRTGTASDVEKLLAADKSLVNSKDAMGSTALHHAAAFGQLATVKLLLDKGADVNAKNRRASTPMHWAIRDEAKLRLLLDKGGNVNAKQADGRSLLYQAASLGNGDSILRMLLERGADPNAATTNGQTPLMAASTRGNVAAMQMLLDKKTDVNARNGAGATPLMGAAGSRNPAAVALLLAKGADVNAQTKKQETALANATTAGVTEAVKLLLDKGARVNVADDRGYSPLMYAAASESMNAEVVRMLLAKGADTKQTGEGETARTLAAKRGESEVARLLGVSEEERRQIGMAPLPAASHDNRSTTEAVSKALALLEKQSHNFIRIGGCNSCHAQDLPSAATGLARDRGIPTPKAIEQLQEAMNGETPERILDFGAVNVASIAWEMVDRGMNHAPKDAYSDAAVYYIKAMLSPEGYWKNADGRRPPMNTGDLQATALSIYSLRTYSPDAEKAETNKILAGAVAWLEKVQPVTTQEHAFHLMALAWAGAPKADINRSAQALVAMQRADGGWGQHPGMGSDAYASGQALYALNTAGRKPADAVYQKGVQFLMRAQAEDGSWHVRTRSIWIQPYFDSGFPYEHDQWISAAGTAWASMALSVTVEPAGIQASASLR